MKHLLLLALIVFSSLGAAHATDASSLWPQLEPVYTDLHAHPELSLQETATAAKMAAKLEALGFKVTTGVGKTGVVGVLTNGAGPTVMLRTELDGLPVEEKTGLPYASKAMATNAAGDAVHVMHACGHDVHMTAWLGAATLLARARSTWHGTLVMVGQPAEEVGAGARAMLDDGLFTRFPRPDAAIAVHDTEQLAAGTVGIRSGPVLASADSVDIVFYGRGGHGARPNTTIDPIVIGAKIVLSLQTLVSRENDPLDPAVVTVGSFHAGTKHNIIPDTAHLQLTVRAYSDAVRDRLLAGIARIAKAEAEGANAPKPPDVTLSDRSYVTVNDPALTTRVEAALRKSLGDTRIVEQFRIMGAEDFSEYGRAGVPALTMQIGATAPDVFAAAKRDGTTLPSLHSALFAPDARPAITTGVEALVAAARSVFGK
jgi:hippurate hydrolase